MGESFVVNSRVKEEVKAHGDKSLAGDFSDALSEKVKVLILDAVRRATDNGRATVMARDL